ncbi:MAG TPA: universal stress protein [Gaiellales bacterium]|jgi:nucleotide-binding universal stress UspA family protein
MSALRELAIRRRAAPLPGAGELTVERLVIASEGRAIPWAVLQQAFDLARPHRAEVRVITIARVFGTSLGFPNPGLLPNKREWDEQRLIVRQTVQALKKAGFEASGHVVGTRKATKRIVAEVEAFEADAVVMGCDPDRGRRGDFVWAHEPYRVARKARVPVYLVPLDAG